MTLLEKVLAVGLLGACLVGTVWISILHGTIKRRDQTIENAVAEAAEALGGVKAQLSNEKAITLHLNQENAKFVAKLKAVDKRVEPTLRAEALASVTDEIPIGPDEHRFVLAPDLHSLLRRQKFSLELVVVRGVTGDKLGKVTLEELDPDTLKPLGPVKIDQTRIEYADEPRVEAPLFHPRVVAGVTNPAYAVVGVQLLNGERIGGVAEHLNAGVLAGYNPKLKQPFGQAYLAFRPFNWTVSFGPTYTFPSGSFGAAAVVELTR